MPKEYFSVDRTTSINSIPKGSRVHVVGVCGVAMAQLAALLAARGFEVSGSDKDFYEPMGSLLNRSKVRCLRGYNPTNIPDGVSLVVIGNAVSYENVEVQAIESRKLPYTLFPKVLFESVIQGKHSIVVSGTHGKTTTSAMTAVIFDRAGKKPGYFIGGVAKDLPSSLEEGAGNVCVIEGDEYDSSFFAKVPKFSFYAPRTLIVSSIEFDHADIYSDLGAIEKEFRNVSKSVPSDGLVIACIDYPSVAKIVSELRKEGKRVVTYGDSEGADIRLLEITELNGLQSARLKMSDGREEWISLSIPGRYNMKNAIAACRAAEEAGVLWGDAVSSLKTFKGVRRRQDVRIEKGGITLVEDFAHHPTAVRETLMGVKARYPDRRVWAVFEPRSNTSRKKVFQNDYVTAFGFAARTILCEVAARSNDSADNLLDVKVLGSKITDAGTPTEVLPDADSIRAYLMKELRTGDVVVVMSNGSFGGLPATLENEIAKFK